MINEEQYSMEVLGVQFSTMSLSLSVSSSPNIKTTLADNMDLLEIVMVLHGLLIRLYMDL